MRSSMAKYFAWEHILMAPIKMS